MNVNADDVAAVLVAHRGRGGQFGAAAGGQQGRGQRGRDAAGGGGRGGAGSGAGEPTWM